MNRSLDLLRPSACFSAYTQATLCVSKLIISHDKLKAAIIKKNSMGFNNDYLSALSESHPESLNKALITVWQALNFIKHFNYLHTKSYFLTRFFVKQLSPYLMGLFHILFKS